MDATTVDISEKSRELLRELTEKTGQTAAEVVDLAIVAYHRQVFADDADAKLRANPEAWAEYQADQKEWDDPPADDAKPDLF